jgi:hypothetical protein
MFDDLTDSTSTAVLDNPPKEMTPASGMFSDLVEQPQRENPQQASERAGIAFDLATEHNVPLNYAQSFVAGPEPSAFGKYIKKIRDYINEKTGLLGYDTRPLGESYYREEHPLKTTLRVGAYASAAYASGLTATAADVLTNKITGDKTLADLVARLTGFEPTQEEQKAMRTSEYVSAFMPVSWWAGEYTTEVFRLAQAPVAWYLKTILDAGLTFGTVESAVQFSRHITDGTPVSWKNIHLASAYGTLFGMGEVALTAAMTGLAKGFEKYWGTRDIELSKMNIFGTTLQEQKAIQEAEKRRDIQRTKDSIKAGNGVPQDLMEKYVYGKPKAEQMGEPAPTAEVKPVAPLAKQSYEMTWPEYRQKEWFDKLPPEKMALVEDKTKMTSLQLGGYNMAENQFMQAHEAAVKQALSEGKTIPPEVLAEYPELGKPAKPEIATYEQLVNKWGEDAVTEAEEKLSDENQAYIDIEDKFVELDNADKGETPEAVKLETQLFQMIDDLLSAKEKPPTEEIRPMTEQPILKLDKFPVQEVSIKSLKLSKEVPTFKEEADKLTGVVRGEQLQGKYEKLATAPIVVWERLDGTMEVITGRHRLDLAKRNLEKTIPAQIVKESEGFDKAMAMTVDAESNIREGQGSIKDYANYFRNTEITEQEARARGLLARVKGKTGFVIGKSAVDDVYARFLGGKLSESQAYAIASGAPNNELVQLAAAAKADSMSPEELEQYARILARTTPSDKLKATQGSLFGFDESALLEAEAIAKEVSKETAAVKDRILSVKGALKRPETARKMGLEFSDEPSIRREVQRLESRLEELQHTSTSPELYAEMKNRVALQEAKQPRLFRTGSTPIIPVLAEEMINTTKLAGKNVTELAAGLPKTITYYTGRAAEVIEKNYGSIPEGKQIAQDSREIAFQTASRESKQRDDFEKVIKGLSYSERIKLGKMGQKRAAYADNKKLQEINAKLLEIMDRDMTAADEAGYRRLLGDEWHNLQGSGGWFPQVLNDTGKLRMKEAQQEGLGNPHIKQAAEEMVKSGDAGSVEEALGRMIDWNNHSVRGTHGYFESRRTLLPYTWVELDIAKVLPTTIHKNAKMIAAAKVWGVEYQRSSEPVLFEGVSPDVESKRLDFTKFRQYVGKIGTEFGSTHKEALKKWVRTEFGLANDLPEFVENTVNLINRYETNIRLGFRLPSAIRNWTQGDTNLFTAPLQAHIKTANIVMFRKWSKVAEQLYEEAKRSGAVSGMKEMAELERGAGAEPITGGLALKMFTSAEESNHIRAALIARFSAEKHIRDLAALKEGGILTRILNSIKYLSVNPEDYLERFIKNRTFTNPITEQELDNIWSGNKPLTLEDAERIMHRASVDTQFINDFASRPIPWRTNPLLRMGLKFKTFAINQTRLLYQDAIKEAIKGTFAPLLKYLLFSAMAGELWNLTKDFIVGGDNALITELINRPEKRNLKDISLGLANDFVDGAGVGILTDMSYGIGNWVIGPAGQTGKNLLEWASNLRHPVMATRKLAFKEFAVSRDIEGLTARADKMFFNSNNRFFEYKRARDRSFEWLESQKHPGFWTATGKIALKMLLGQQKYPAILPYEYAARQITLGDVEDAADYLADALKSDSRDRDTVLDSIRTSMNNYSPLGHIADKDMDKFLSQFPQEERRAMRKLQTDWIADYKKAIDIAKRSVGGLSTGQPKRKI